MGLIKPCLSTSVSSGSAEIAIIEMYDEILARSTSPGMDDSLGEPFLVDTDDDGIGERVRPGTIVSVKAKSNFSRYQEQNQDEIGNAERSLVEITLFKDDLKAKGLLANGILEIRTNDRLLRLEDGLGNIIVDLEAGNRKGLYCFDAPPGETGTGVYNLLFESRRPVSR